MISEMSYQGQRQGHFSTIVLQLLHSHFWELPIQNDHYRYMFLTFSILTFHVTILGLFFTVVRSPKKDVVQADLAISLGLFLAGVEVDLLVLSLGGLLAELPLLSSLDVSLDNHLLANSFRVLPVLILTSEDPLHPVLKSPLLLSNNMPHAERVDIGSIVDLVHEVLCGIDSVLEFVLGLLIIVDAREDTWF